MWFAARHVWPSAGSPEYAGYPALSSPAFPASCPHPSVAPALQAPSAHFAAQSDFTYVGAYVYFIVLLYLLAVHASSILCKSNRNQSFFLIIFMEDAKMGPEQVQCAARNAIKQAPAQRGLAVISPLLDYL